MKNCAEGNGRTGNTRKGAFAAGSHAHTCAIIIWPLYCAGTMAWPAIVAIAADTCAASAAVVAASAGLAGSLVGSCGAKRTRSERNRAVGGGAVHVRAGVRGARVCGPWPSSSSSLVALPYNWTHLRPLLLGRVLLSVLGRHGAVRLSVCGTRNGGGSRGGEVGPGSRGRAVAQGRYGGMI